MKGCGTRSLIFLSGLLLVVILACGRDKPELMTPHEYLRIESEVITSDMKPETVKTIVVKHGFSYEEYRRFEKKVQNDEKLRETLGEIRLNSQEGNEEF